jgi:hypothetical protein
MSMPPDSYWKDSGKRPSFRKQLKAIDAPVAEERFTYRNAQGKRITSRVVIGRPEPAPKDSGADWYCPVLIENWHLKGIVPILSMGPVGALVNAGSVVRAFLEEVLAPEASSPGKRSGRKAEAKVRVSKTATVKQPGKAPAAKQAPRKKPARKRSAKSR